MTVTFGWWLLPLLVTIFCVAKLFKPSKAMGIAGAVEALSRIPYLILILFLWLVYCVIRIAFGVI